MDINKLTTPGKIAAGAGAGALINLFLPWYRVSYFGVSASANAFDAGFFAWAAMLTLLGAASILVLKQLEVFDLKASPLEAEHFALIGAAIAALSVLIRLLTESSSIFIGLFLGLVLSGLMCYAAYQAMTDSGLSLPSAEDFKSMSAPNFQQGQAPPQQGGYQAPGAPQPGGYQAPGAPQAPQAGSYTPPPQPSAPQTPQAPQPGAYQPPPSAPGVPQAPQPGSYAPPPQPSAPQAPQAGGYQPQPPQQGGYAPPPQSAQGNHLQQQPLPQDRSQGIEEF